MNGSMIWGDWGMRTNGNINNKRCLYSQNGCWRWTQEGGYIRSCGQFYKYEMGYLPY